MKNTKMGFTTSIVASIPRSRLNRRIMRELFTRETFIDTNDESDEQIFNSDVFEVIACEQAELSENSPLRLRLSDLELINKLAEDMSAANVDLVWVIAS